MRLLAIPVLLSGFLSLPLLADFSYQQTSRITGGSMTKMMRMVPGGGKALEPQTTTHLLQGDRMATVGSNYIDVIDVGRQTMTHIDLDKKSYSTITFEEFRQAMLAMQKKMAEQMGKGGNQAAIDFRVEVKDTAETKPVSGMNTKLMKLLLAMDMKDAKSGQTVTMNIENDMWMTPSIPGYQEVLAFQKKYAEAIGITPEMLKMSRMAMGQPGMSEGMAKMAKEAAKLQGVPLITVTRMMGMGMPGGEGGEAPEVKMPTQREVGDSAANSAASSALGRLGGIGGRLGGFGRKKKEEPKEEPKVEQPPAQAQAPAGPPKQSVFMEVTMESSNYSSGAVDGSKFAVPAGFKEVEHEMKKSLREMK